MSENENFQPGDRVRIVAFPTQPQTVGEVVTVVEVVSSENGFWPLRVRFDGDKYPKSCLDFNEVERVLKPRLSTTQEKR